jgi:hypothetical protein
MISRMSEEESLSLLRRQADRMARLRRRRRSLRRSVNYVFDGRFVISHALPGRKLTAMREHPRMYIALVRRQEAADPCGRVS